MQMDIEMPEPWEASLCYIDGTKSFNLYIRQKGDTWWKVAHNCIGHAHTPKEELLQEATKLAKEYISQPWNN